MYKRNRILIEAFLFVKRHVVIIILCFICGFIITKFSKITIPSWMPEPIVSLFLRPQEETDSFEWWSIINNLSLAFIASILTYLLIQYIPERIRAYKAFLFLKKDLTGLYAVMSQMVDMYLFEMGIKTPERQIKIEQLSGICNVEIADKVTNCKIETIRDGEYAHVSSLGYNLYKDSKKHAESMRKYMDSMKMSISFSYIDSDIAAILSTIENNWFLNYFLKMETPTTKTPGVKNIILNFDKGFYEFIRCHIQLQKYKFTHYSYEFIELSDEEMASEKEKMLFISSRLAFKHLGLKKVKKIADQIVALEPSEDRIRKSEGVMLEMLVCYDYESEKHKEVLDAALKIANYIKDNETDRDALLYDTLNCLQIKKRMNALSEEDIIKLQDIIIDENSPCEVALGASIICGNLDEATNAFEQLSDKQKESFAQLPIYLLWPNPPVEPNPNPPCFLQADKTSGKDDE